MSIPQNVHMLSRDAPGRCSGTNAAGEPCGAICQVDSQWCWSHDPDNTEDMKRQRSEAAKEGHTQKGHRRRPLEDQPATRRPPLSLTTLIRAVANTIEQVRSGELDAHRATAVGQLAKVQQGLLRDKYDQDKLGLKSSDIKSLTNDQLDELERAAANAPS